MNYKIQIIPKLISIESNRPRIKCLSFWDDKKKGRFFPFDECSDLRFSYNVCRKIEACPERITLRFSNISYHENKWYFSLKKWGVKFAFTINENNNAITVNNIYHKLFIKIGFLEPMGYILTDYITYKLEKMGCYYFDGAAANINNKTFLFFGFGRNFKTTLINTILENNGRYIGEEFFLLKGNEVYATIPNMPHFDIRRSHKKLLGKNLENNKLDTSEYGAVVFLVYSCKNEFVEISQNDANRYAKLYHRMINTYYYSFFKSRDILMGEEIKEKELLSNEKARYFIVYFTDINNVYDFIKNI